VAARLPRPRRGGGGGGGTAFNLKNRINLFCI